MSTVQTVRALEWTLEGVGRLHRTVTALPSPAAGEILVGTKVGAISPGAERSLLHGTSPSVPHSNYPYQPGYLNIVTILDASDRTLIGERGVAILGHRDFALIPYHRFVRMPVAVPDEIGLLGVLAADARHGIDVAAVESAEDCLVIGGGILGVLTAWELCFKTTGAIRIVEIDAARRETIGNITFPREVAVDEEPGRTPFHTVFECANTQSAFELAQASARSKGSIVVIADGSHESYTLTRDFFSKGLYLGKTDSHPDLRGFLGEFFARDEDRSTLVATGFQIELRFEDYPQAYLKALLAPDEEDRRGLLPRVLYG
jgi:2-desacetyl-2-hydroxyethyl bacteriochlorophyllide A dehydrogenase